MIKRRNAVMVPILFVITFGIYGLYWLYSTSDEVIKYNKSNDNALLWLVLALIPPLNIIAIWMHSQAIARMSASGNGRGINGVLLFILWFVPVPVLIGTFLSQVELNKRAGQATASSGEAPATSEEPAPSSEESSAGPEEASTGDQA